MKKVAWIVLFTVRCTNLYAQNPTLEQKYYYTCKIWGFAKYFHSRVSNCQVNWDSVLLQTLPSVRTATTGNQFNDVLITMLNAAGPMAIAATPYNDVAPPELKRNRDFSWFNDPTIRQDVRIILDTIKNNFWPHSSCWVQINTNPNQSQNWGGYLFFPFDTVITNQNTNTNYPNEDLRLTTLFKCWNIVRYFDPYNYVLNVSWDSTLFNSVVPVSSAGNAYELYLQNLKLAAALVDAHAYACTYNTSFQFLPGYYKPYLRLKYTNGQYVIIKSSISGIYPGDALISVDGKTMTQWEDSLRPYYSAGNDAVFRRSVASEVLGRTANSTQESLVIEDSNGSQNTYNVYCVWPNIDPSFFYDYCYPQDSISTIKWTSLPCNIGYVNAANMTSSDIDPMYDELHDRPAIIVDLRCSQLIAWQIANKMYQNSTEFAKLMLPNVTYPGTYHWSHSYLGTNGNPTPYSGQVILLIDEATQSSLEYSAMQFDALPNVVKVGSQTAGADGDVTRFSLYQDMRFGFSSVGVFYPNGDSTQRIGIVPDLPVYLTRNGIRSHRDDILERGLLAAGCNLVVNDNNSQPLSCLISPNPFKDIITLKLSGKGNQVINVTLQDIVGHTIFRKQFKSDGSVMIYDFNVNSLTESVYIFSVQTDHDCLTRKIVKQ